MKKFVSLFMCFFILLSLPLVSFSSDTQPWEAEYTRIMQQIPLSEETKYILADVDHNHTPDLIAGNSKTVSLYSFANNSLIKTAEVKDIPIDYFVQLKTAQNNNTNITGFIGQTSYATRLSTYKMYFTDGVPRVEIIATENSDGTGSFKGDNASSEIVPDCGSLVSDYLSEYTLKPFTICVLTAGEIGAAQNFKTAAESLFARYKLLTALSDDTAEFSAQERDAIKSAVGEGQFASFDKISQLGNSNVFVQFYANDPAQPAGQLLPYTKMYALVTKSENTVTVSALYGHESELNTEYLRSLTSAENEASNIYIDYTRTTSFRGIDDYVNYLSTVLSSNGKAANANGKEVISEYMEHAVNRSSRTEIKAENNIVTVNAYSVSFIAENAVACLERLNTLCESEGVTLNRKPRALPELVCTGLDLTRPVRIEFEPGLSGQLAGASGIRLMLDEHHGIYITASDLATLERSTDMFCIEFIHGEDAFSVVFTDKNNQPINYISAPVWFIVPAKSQYSTVMASFQGGTDNWGGQFDANNKTIEFSTNYSGNYQIVENDITINDIADLPSATSDAIRFLVSKGIFTLDKKLNFNPDATLSRYDFTTALVKMFYAMNTDARTTFTDVPENSDVYRYIASAESQGIATGFADGTFRGKKPVSKEQVVTFCGRTLVEKKEYAYPGNYEQYLNFTDAAEISQWARGDVAIAAQCGLIENIGAFSPSNTVSRAEGAEILYKTFMLLYDVSPVTTVSSLYQEETTDAAPAVIDFEFRAAMCIVFTVVLLFIGYIMVKIKKRRKKKQEKQ